MTNDPSGGNPGDPATADVCLYGFRLFVTGTTRLSSAAIVNVRKLCEEHLSGIYELEIVDIAASPERAKLDQIIAIPTLLKFRPEPVRRFIGDMSDSKRIISGIGHTIDK